MKDIQMSKEFLPIQIEKKENSIKLKQERYIEKLLQKFKLEECNIIR